MKSNKGAAGCWAASSAIVRSSRAGRTEGGLELLGDGLGQLVIGQSRDLGRPLQQQERADLSDGRESETYRHPPIAPRYEQTQMLDILIDIQGRLTDSLSSGALSLSAPRNATCSGSSSEPVPGRAVIAAERCHQSMKGSAAKTRAASTSSLTLIRSSV